MMRSTSWKTISSKIIYKNQFVNVIEDKVVKPDGTKGTYSFMKVPRTVGVVPLVDKSIYLCKQFRYIFKDYSWEIPRGFVEYGESIQKAAMRELKEETGFIANNLKDIGAFRLSIGLLNEETKIFLAFIKSNNKRVPYDRHEISDVKKFTIPDAVSLVNKGKIKDGLTATAILLTDQILK